MRLRHSFSVFFCHHLQSLLLKLYPKYDLLFYKNFTSPHFTSPHFTSVYFTSFNVLTSVYLLHFSSIYLTYISIRFPTMFSPVFVIFIAFMLASVLSIDGGLRQDQVEVESTKTKKPHWSPTKKPTEDLSLGEQLKKPTDKKTKKPFWSPTKKPTEDLSLGEQLKKPTNTKTKKPSEESRKPRNSKKPRGAKTEKPYSSAESFLVSSELAADGYISLLI